MDSTEMCAANGAQKNDVADTNYWRWFAGGAAFVFLTMVAVWAMLTFVVFPKEHPGSVTGKPQPVANAAGGAEVEKAKNQDYDPVASRGQFGDMFGVANALFSGLAFTALIVSLAMQRKELALQRQELALARTEFARQADALSEQSDTMDRQAQIELLAARIVGAGSMLQLMQAAAHSSDLQAYLATKKKSTTVGVIQAANELERLMAIADGMKATVRANGG